MSVFANIWQHPKTSLAGVLIAAGTIAGVLGQQGVALGRMGTGTVVSFVGALAAALLGLLARDPESGAEKGADKLGVWMLVALLLSGTLPGTGCTGTSTAQNIVNWMPSLESAVAAVDTVAATLAPDDQAALATVTSSFDALSSLLMTQANAYLATPSATNLSQLQEQIVTLQQQVNRALLEVAKITNSTSQQHVLAAVQAVATIVTAVLALVQSVSSQADVQRMAARSTVKLAQVQPFLDRKAASELVAAHSGEPLARVDAQMARAEAELRGAGF